MSNVFLVPVTIAKADIAVCGSMKGQANAELLLIGEFEADAEAVVFCGFVGARIPDGSYEGVFKFEPSIDGVTYETFDELPGVPSATPVSIEESEVDDGVHCDITRESGAERGDADSVE